MGPIVGAASVSALGSLAASGLNAFSQREQRSYDYQQWLKMAEYNKPSNQVRRLREAGINPALALQNIGTGNVDSHAGGQSPVDFSPVADGANSVGSMMSQQDLISAQAREHNANASIQEFNASAQQTRLTMELQTQLLGLQEQRTRIASSAVESDYKRKLISQIDSQIENLKLDTLFNRETLNDRKRAVQLQNREINSRISLQNAQTAYQGLLAKYYPQLSQQQIDLMGSQIKVMQETAKNLVIDGTIKTFDALNGYYESEMKKIAKDELQHKVGVRDTNLLSRFLYDTGQYVGDILGAPFVGILKK